ncbi:MAG: hypothetical protein CVU33_17345 [Betaproteobacteria bacterium HGW-Betaproteobacteria-6]|jgi:hypothetical protein|nr:MAG: hypothetical protein CVU33_17345 [Betaproteobacteria bacterium HGW-Betaproteobacteria-6]
MKRSNTHLGKHIPPVCLYQEDLSAISAALAQDDGKLAIETDEFEYDSLDELLSNLGDSLNGLSLKRKAPYISVDFDSRGGVWLYASNDDLVSRGIFAEIQELLVSKRRQSYFMLRRFVDASSWVGAAGIGAFLVAGHWREAMLSSLLPLLSIAFIFVKPRSIVNRTSRAQRKNFWQRNSDQIVVALISAVAGSILTLAATALFPGGKF